ncbi:MAG: putative metal-binding motif-containing protein [Pseudomonadota bacterium]|nr:putative metal-binding motif-containing protein [Pseudomonadota bacterium]
MRTALLLLVLPLATVGCTPLDTGFQKPDTDEPVDTADTDTDTEPIDTADTDGDLDDDGFTPEDGDCDDDNIRVSPAREEDDSDGLDNDCDGRVDEEWSGFSVGRVDDNGAGSIIVLDTIGRDDDTVNLSNGCVPSWLDHYGEGWAISNGGAAVSVVDVAGTCTDLADFSDTEVYEYGVWGIATMPDGFGLDGIVLATTVTSLEGVAADGTVTQLASWVVDFEDIAAHEFAAVSAAVDPATGQVGLFDYFGGFGTWTPDGGLVVHRKGDWESPTLMTTSGAHRDGGGWYTQGTDATTGAMGVYQFDLDAGDWVLIEGWADDTWSPAQVAIDGDSGDFYLTANVSGIFPSVYRIVDGSGYAADFFRIETDYAGYFYGIATNYTHGG